MNTVTLTTGIPLFGGLDDELAISDSPGGGLRPVFDLGVDAIQTDWPALVRDYRTSWYRDHPERCPAHAEHSGRHLSRQARRAR